MNKYGVKLSQKSLRQRIMNYGCDSTKVLLGLYDDFRGSHRSVFDPLERSLTSSRGRVKLSFGVSKLVTVYGVTYLPNNADITSLSLEKEYDDKSSIVVYTGFYEDWYSISVRQGKVLEYDFDIPYPEMFREAAKCLNQIADDIESIEKKFEPVL